MSETPGHWKLRIDDEAIAWLSLDRQNASANTLGREVMEQLDRCLARIEQARPRALVLCSAKDSGFVAGADITEFDGLTDAGQAYALVRAGQQVLDRLEGLPCITVAAIHGFALGGGLELALACRYRVGADDGRLVLGLPEVMLGIHPGFGGTVRAPRLLGAPAALDLMLTGRTVRGDKARQLGLVDTLVPREQLHSAARELALAAPPVRRPGLGARLLSWPGIRSLVAAQTRKQVARRARPEHYPAPYAILKLFAKHGASGSVAYEAEARSIASLLLTPTSRNLVRVFFLQERLKALASGQARRFRRIHVVGAGVMGGDIAAWCAYRGMTVTLQDRGEQFITPALDRARAFFAKRCRKPGQADECNRRLVSDVAGDGVAEADLVIEAIFEDAAAKRELYARLEPCMRPDALLATNTSSIMLEELSRDLADPGRLLGLHFFNPVARMMLVEIVRAAATRASCIHDAVAFARQLDKLPLPCRSAPGFAVNRILTPYMTEAMFAIEEGVPLAEIDRVATEFGMPIGPVELADTVGLDVAMQVGRILAEAYGRSAPTGIKALVDAGRVGRKSGQGYYEWRDGKPVKPPAASKAPDDLQDRLVLQYLNETVGCLQDGVVEDADLLDAGMIFGTGFAPFRGGPVQYIRTRGAGGLVARLEELERRHGPRFRPNSGWRTLPALHAQAL